MSDHVKLKSRDGCAECECPEKYAVALVASGKWIRVESCSHAAIIGLDGCWHCQRCGDAIDMASAQSPANQGDTP